MQHRPEIDGLRALAVVPVILFHAGFETFGGGFVGVDVFFVISGFLITTIILDELKRENFSISKFYERRARRILPALFFVIACSVPAAILLMIPTQLEDFARSVLAVVFFVSNILFWRETGYFAPAAEEQPLLHTWSLAVEEQFYVLFPLALVGLWRFGRTRTLLVFAIITGVSLLASEIASRVAPAANFYFLPTRAWELLAGALCAFALQNGAALQKGVPGDAAALVGLALIGVAIFGFTERTPTPSVYAVIPVAGTCLVLLFAHASTLAAWLLSARPFVAIGLISYSAYLWHQPFLAFARIGFNGTPSDEVRLLIVASTLPLAYLTWRFVETPFRRQMSPSVVFRSTVTAALAFTITALAALSFDGFRTFYMHYRLTPEQARVFELVQRQIDIKMESTQFDDGACRFPARSITNDFKRRFTACAERHGPGIVVLGDSHAMNIYNILAKSELGPFLVSVARGGCRPQDDDPQCPYDDFAAWAAEERQNIRTVIYHQSGAHLLRDRNGKVDSSKTFKDGAPFLLAEDGLKSTVNYLAKLAQSIRVTWLGPYVEARVRFEDLEYLRAGLMIKEISLSHFAELDQILKSYKTSGAESYRYVSLVDFLAIGRDFLRIGDCVTFWDVDHFSACGEDLLARKDWRTLLLQPQTSGG